MIQAVGKSIMKDTSLLPLELQTLTVYLTLDSDEHIKNSPLGYGVASVRPGSQMPFITN